MSEAHEERFTGEQLADALGNPLAPALLEAMVEAGTATDPVDAIVQLGGNREQAEAAWALTVELRQPMDDAVDAAMAGEWGKAGALVGTIRNLGPVALAGAMWGWAREATRYGTPHGVGVVDRTTGAPAGMPQGMSDEDRALRYAVGFITAALAGDMAGAYAIFNQVGDPRVATKEIAFDFVRKVLESAAQVRRQVREEQAS